MPSPESTQFQVGSNGLDLSPLIGISFSDSLTTISQLTLMPADYTTELYQCSPARHRPMLLVVLHTPIWRTKETLTLVKSRITKEPTYSGTSSTWDTLDPPDKSNSLFNTPLASNKRPRITSTTSSLNNSISCSETTDTRTSRDLSKQSRLTQAQVVSSLDHSKMIVMMTVF